MQARRTIPFAHARLRGGPCLRPRKGWHRICYSASEVNHHILEYQTITGCSQPWQKALNGQYLKSEQALSVESKVKEGGSG